MATSEKPLHPLKAARKERGMTQQAVASHVGCAVSYVCMVEKGLVPPLPKQEAMAAAVGQPAGAIFE